MVYNEMTRTSLVIFIEKFSVGLVKILNNFQFFIFGLLNLKRVIKYLVSFLEEPSVLDSTCRLRRGSISSIIQQCVHTVTPQLTLLE